jgi:hypothetical protein
MSQNAAEVIATEETKARWSGGADLLDFVRALDLLGDFLVEWALWRRRAGLRAACAELQERLRRLQSPMVSPLHLGAEELGRDIRRYLCARDEAWCRSEDVGWNWRTRRGAEGAERDLRKSLKVLEAASIDMFQAATELAECVTRAAAECLTAGEAAHAPAARKALDVFHAALDFVPGCRSSVLQELRAKQMLQTLADLAGESGEVELGQMIGGVQ